MIRKEFLPLARPDISEAEIQNAIEVIKSGWWTTGPAVTEFENELCQYLQEDNALYAVGLNSCTSAMHMALLALGIKSGDEVILPTWTFVSTAHVVEWVGAKPVLCDIDEKTLNIDTQKILQLITPKTKAIMPVHMAGYPCNMDEIAAIAEKYNLFVVEDAAHAIGTKYNGTKIGNFSDVTCFSFYATKNLAMGEGGAAVSRNPDLIEKIRKLSYFGINKEAFKRYSRAGTWRYDIETIGYKNNLDSIHAAIGCAQLKRLDSMNERRRDIAQKYRENLSEKLWVPRDDNQHFHTYHLFPVRLNTNGIERDDMIDALKKRNIGTSVHFIPLHLHTYYRKISLKADFPSANAVFKVIFSLPMCSSMADEDVSYVITHVNELVNDRINY